MCIRDSNKASILPAEIYGALNALRQAMIALSINQNKQQSTAASGGDNYVFYASGGDSVVTTVAGQGTRMGKLGREMPELLY